MIDPARSSAAVPEAFGSAEIDSPVVNFVRRWYGRNVMSKPTATTAGTAQAVLMGNNPNRFAFTVVNLSANNIFIAPDLAGAPSSTNGIQLQPNGGFANVRVDQDGELPAYGWNIIAAANGSNFFLVEVLAL